MRGWLGVAVVAVLATACEQRTDARSTPSVTTGSAVPAPAPELRSAAQPPKFDGAEADDIDAEEIIEVDDTVDSIDEHGSMCAPIDPDLKPMAVLRFRFTSNVRDRDAVDKLSVLRPGQRVYAYFRMRNRSGHSRCLKLTFRVNGKKRTTLTLGVGKSWSWRTWGYNTLRPDDRGFLEVEAIDDQGKVVLKEHMAIVPARG